MQVSLISNVISICSQSQLFISVVRCGMFELQCILHGGLYHYVNAHYAFKWVEYHLINGTQHSSFKTCSTSTYLSKTSYVLSTSLEKQPFGIFISISITPNIDSNGGCHVLGAVTITTLALATKTGVRWTLHWCWHFLLRRRASNPNTSEAQVECCKRYTLNI